MTIADYTEDEKVEVKLAFYLMLEKLTLSSEQAEATITFMENYLILSAEQERLFDLQFNPEEVPRVMEYITSFERKGEKKGFKKGFATAENLTRENVAKALLKEEYPLEGIARITGLSLQKILSLI